MFRIENTWVLWGLALVPIMVLGFYAVKAWKKKARARFAERQLLQQIMPGVSSFKIGLKFTLFLSAYVLLIIGLANPQIGTKMEEVKREGLDIILALDVSNSMKAEDLSPNRLERAKRGTLQMLEELKGDRLGIIVFAGQAYTQLPITTDYAAAKLFLSTVDTDIVPTQGTAIGAAIELAMESYDFEGGGQKALIIVTDGENHEDDAISAAEAAQEKGVKVFTVGMGTPMGAPIPIKRRGKPAGFRQDNEGNTVISSLNEDMLADIAAAGNGIYVRASNANSGLETVLGELSGLDKAEFESSVYTDYEDRFQFFIGAAFILLLFSLVISEKKSVLSEKVKLFES